MEELEKVNHSNIWKQIFEIIDLLSLEKCDGDSYDKRSITTKLEKLFKKLK